MTSTLRLKPGLIGRAPVSTDPVSADEEAENFTCVVVHDWFPTENKQQQKTVAIKLLCKYPKVDERMPKLQHNLRRSLCICPSMTRLDRDGVIYYLCVLWCVSALLLMSIKLIQI